MKNYNNLYKKIVTDKNGHRKTVWVKTKKAEPSKEKKAKIKEGIKHFKDKKRSEKDWFKRVGSAFAGHGMEHEKTLAKYDKYIANLKKQLK